jgi:hypothetical protein
MRRQRSDCRFGPLVSAFAFLIGVTTYASNAAAQATTQLPSQQQSLLPTRTSSGATSPKTPDAAARAAKIAVELREAVSKCWQIDGPPSGLAATAVVIAFELKPSGALSRKPHIVNQRGQPTNVGLAASAIKAVEACAPYTGLPAEMFATGWRNVRMTFDTKGLR